MSYTRETFLELVSEYLYLEEETYNVYSFKKSGIHTVTWFLEMLWTSSKKFDVRTVIEDAIDEIRIYLRTDDAHWELFDD